MDITHSGWGSWLSNFKSYEQAIESLRENLGGANPNTARYYAGKSTMEKTLLLQRYCTSYIPRRSSGYYEKNRD